MFNIVNFLFLISLFSTTSLFCVEKTENISTKSAVIFNILCAKCHEVECSGRLSFDTGSDKAKNHIKRYTEDTNLTDDKTKEFFTLLNYMKKECTILMPKSKKYKSDNLSNFILPSQKGYFISLGLLENGIYHLNIQTKEKIHFKIEVITNHFESLLNQSICPDQKEQTLSFSVEKPINIFIRITSRKTFQITTLKIKKE